METIVKPVLDKYLTIVQEAYPSVFNKEDVAKILLDFTADLNNIADDIAQNHELELINDVKERVLSVIENFDYDGSTEINLNYDGRSIEVEFDCNELSSEVEDIFDNL